MKSFMLFFVIVAPLSIVLAQPPNATTCWSTHYGPSATDDEAAYALTLTFDGGYVLAGYREVGNPLTSDLYIVKFDADRDVEWTWTGTNPYYQDTLFAIIQTPDSGFVAAGTYGTAGGGQQAYLVRLNSSGSASWTRQYGSTGNDAAYGICLSADGDYIFTGYTSSTGNDQLWIVEVDAADGDEQWSETSGGNSSESGFDIQLTSDDGYIVTGYTNSTGPGGKSLYLVKIEAEDVDWTNAYGTANDDVAYGVREVSDGFVMTGYTVSGGETNGYLLKTNLSGTQQWSQSYDRGDDDAFFDLEKTADGGFILAGFSDNGQQNIDLYTVKTASDGDQEWYHLVDLSQLDNISFDVAIVETDTYIHGGTTAANNVGLQMWLTCVQAPTIDAPEELTVYRDGTTNGADLRWESITYADSYYVFSSSTYEGTYSVLAGTATNSYFDSGLQSMRFYRVIAKDTGTNTVSNTSNCAGYVKFTAVADGLTAFGLPFTFWDVSAGNIPNFGIESTDPSDIMDGQPTCGAYIFTADNIQRQDNGEQAFRNCSNVWSGDLQTNSGMIPGEAFWYRNRTQSNLDITLCGQVDNSGDYGSITINGSGYTEISWRDARFVSRENLNLLEDGFEGGTTAGTSDQVVTQGGSGDIFWRRTTDNTWQGLLEEIEPGRAYWILNRDAEAWTYSYDGD